MLRQAFTDRLKQALKAGDARTLSTIRLILAGLKDRDIAGADKVMQRESPRPRSSGCCRR
jgi:uncharacterized protein YqeY